MIYVYWFTAGYFYLTMYPGYHSTLTHIDSYHFLKMIALNECFKHFSNFQ